MRQIIMIFFAAMTLTACGQTDSDKTINNVMTKKHINIPRTRLCIVPPSSYKIASNFVGLQKDDNTAIQVYDLIGGSFYSNAATFSKEKFENKGAKVFDYKELSINGFPAKYIFMQGDPTIKAYSLVFGDSTFSTMIMAVFPANDSKASEEIKDALFSILYDKNLKIDPLANATFKFDDNTSKFKFFKSAANLYLYSIGGIEDKSNENAPIVTIIPLPADNTMTPESISELLLASLEKYGLEGKEIKNKSNKKINGYITFEAEVYGNMKGQKSLVYQLIVVNGDKALAIQGICKSDFENNIVEFNKLAHSVRFK